MLKTFKRCWPVDNDGLHTFNCMTVVLQKLPVGRIGGVKNTTAIDLEVTNGEIVIHKRSRNADLTMPGVKQQRAAHS